MRAPVALILLVAAALVVAILWPGGKGPPAGLERVDRDSARDTEADVEPPDHVAPDRTPAAARSEGAGTPAARDAEPVADEEPFFTIEGTVLERRPSGSLETLGARTLRVGSGKSAVVQQSEADGSFRIELPRRGVGPAAVMLYAPAVEGSPLVPWSRRMDFGPGQWLIEDVRVVLQTAPAIVGRVEDIDGNAVAGARIALGEHRAQSRADGRFDLGPVPGLDLHLPHSIEGELSCALEGYTVLAVRVPGYDADDLWQPAQIAVAPTAPVQVRLLEGDGTPHVGEQVLLRTAIEEPWRASERNALGFSLRPQRAETGEDGVAQFDAVPAGPHLEVSALGQRSVWMRGGELLKDDLGGARPIVAAAGKPLGLRLQSAPVIAVSGTVLEPDGSPSPRAYVRFTDVRGERVAGQLRADADGRFVRRVPLEGALDRVVVTAQSAVGEEPVYSPFGGRKYVKNFPWGSATVAVRGRTEAEVKIRCAPSIEVQGTVLDPDGQPVVSGSVLLVREGEVPRRVLRSGEWARSRVRRGEFLFRGVDAGTYRVHVRGGELGLLVSEPFEAGGRPLELRFQRADPARVTLVVEGVEAPGDALLEVEWGPVDFLQDPAAPPLLANGTRFVGPVGDPRAALDLAVDRRAVTTAEHSVDLLRESIVPGEEHVLELSAGPVVIGVRGTDGLGRPLAPVGTGLVRVAAGESRIVLVPARTGQLRVAVPDVRPGECFEVRDASGALLAPLATSGTVRTRLRLPRSGVRVVQVAHGRVRVAVGTPDELERGAPRKTFAVDVN